MISTFWHWYIGLFSDPDDKVRLAAWSATLATITFLIAFVLKPSREWIKGLFKKVNVEAGVSHTIIQAPYLGTAVGSPVLTCKVTNKSSNAVHLTGVAIKTSKKITEFNTDTFSALSVHGIKYPIKLDPGGQSTSQHDLVGLRHQVLGHLQESDTVRFVVTSTLGKKWKSNAFTVKHLVGHIELAARM